MNKICTSVEQSQKLIELGIDINTADMLWVEDCDHNFDLEVRVNVVESYNPDNLIIVPAWSLTALLDILPKIIKHKTFLIELVPLFIETSALLWHIGYRDIYIAKEDNLLDAAFEMVVWLKENGKL